MAKLKSDWLAEAQALGLELTANHKIADIKAAIAAAKGLESPVTGAELPAKDEGLTTEDKELKTASEPLAKAGKRSKKGQELAAVKAQKEARKRGDEFGSDKSYKDPDQEPEVKKGPIPITRPRLERRSRRYQAAAAKVDQTKDYQLDEAIALAINTSKVKFDPTVELHVRLNADPKQADQNIRETVILPSGTGKTLRVAVLAEESDHQPAKDAGADLVGDKSIIDALSQGQLDFDVLIATPTMMGQLGRFAKLLGPKGLMPNPKSGTVTSKVAMAVEQAKAGRVEFRIDKDGNVHVPIGKTSFGSAKLMSNARAVLAAIKTAKPSSIKGQYVMSAHLTTAMGPSVRLAANDLLSTKA